MVWSFKKACLVLTVILVTTLIIRIILSNHLDSVEAYRRFSRDKLMANSNLKYKFLKTIQENSVLDSSGHYQIVPFLFRAFNFGPNKRVKKDLGMVTQTSSNQLLLLHDLSQRWQGPISVAIFSEDSNLSNAVDRILFLLQCYPKVQYNTSIHLVFPLNNWSENLQEFNETKECKYLQQSQKQISYSNSKIAYPVNLLRNVARKHSMTEFIIVVDVDLIPSLNFPSQFLDFATKENLFIEPNLSDKVVYVVPTYEMNEKIIDSSVPNDKASLMERIALKQVRPFYVQVCWRCQKHTDYKSWEEAPFSDSVDVLYEIPWKDPWEPFYISRSNVPMYDERFKQYGFNRISQVCELHVAGYKFVVLNNLFLIHRGLKEVDMFHSSKDEDQERNRILFRHFKNDLQEKYSNSNRKCI